MLKTHTMYPLEPNEELAPRRARPRLEIENVSVSHADFRFLWFRKQNHLILPNSGYHLEPGNVLEIMEEGPRYLRLRTIRALITYANPLTEYGIAPNFICVGLDFDVQNDTPSTLPDHTPGNHELKCDPQIFHAVWAGAKRFEIRNNDRDYKLGDRIKLLEFNRATREYSGAFVKAEIRHIVHDHPALTSGVVSMSLDLITRSKQKPGSGVAL